MHVSAARLEDRDVGVSAYQLVGVCSPWAVGVPEARQPDIVKAKRVHLEPAHAAPVGTAEYQFAAAWRYGAALLVLHLTASTNRVAEDSYMQEKERLREKLNNQRQKLLEVGHCCCWCAAVSTLLLEMLESVCC